MLRKSRRNEDTLDSISRLISKENGTECRVCETNFSDLGQVGFCTFQGHLRQTAELVPFMTYMLEIEEESRSQPAHLLSPDFES